MSGDQASIASAAAPSVGIVGRKTIARRCAGIVYHAPARVASGLGAASHVLFRIVRNLFHRVSHGSDFSRWTSTRNLESWWDARTEQIARLVPDKSRVVEFGAGRRQLQRFLSPSCVYVPSDLIDRGSGTFVCDLNRRPLPDLGR